KHQIDLLAAQQVQTFLCIGSRECLISGLAEVQLQQPAHASFIFDNENGGHALKPWMPLRLQERLPAPPAAGRSRSKPPVLPRSAGHREVQKTRDVRPQFWTRGKDPGPRRFFW